MEVTGFWSYLAIVRKRDEIDSSRAHAPLTAARDAIVVDSPRLSVEEVLRRVHGLIERWQQKAGKR